MNRPLLSFVNRPFIRAVNCPCIKGVFPVLIFLFLSGCGGYAATAEPIRTALSAGRPEKGLQKVNEALDVESEKEVPDDIEEETALLLCERGTILHGLENFDFSSRDYELAEKHLELLDLQNDTAGDIGKWLFSDDATVYKAPAYEKLLLNTMNMLNYLARSDLEGARVEARRMTTIQKYLDNEESEQASLIGLGSYLAGFTFEMSGRAEDAMRYYDEALKYDDYPTLYLAVKSLADQTGYRTKRIDAVLKKMNWQQAPPASAETAPESAESEKPAKGTLLVISETGLVPHKEAMRIPIGAALVIAAHVVHGPGLTGPNRSKANRLAAKGLLKWINFPVLKNTRHSFSNATVGVDGEKIHTDLGLNVAQKVKQAWDSIKGTLMVAAIVRMIARALIAEGTEAAGKGAGAGGVGGLLMGLAVEGALTAADTPDTRSWVTLPAKIFVTRAEMVPGEHTVTIILSGKGGTKTITKKINMPAGGFVVLPVSALR